MCVKKKRMEVVPVAGEGNNAEWLSKSMEFLDWRWISQGFTNGVAIYSALPVLQSVVSRRRVESATWRTAVAAGTFLGGYRLMAQLVFRDKALKRLVQQLGLSDRQKQFVAGAFGAFLGLVIDDHFLGSLLVIWWCLRAVKCALPRSDGGAPVVFMSAAASVLAPAAFLFRDEHQKAYQSFMERMTLGVPRPALLEQASPVTSTPSLHGWSRHVYCDNLHAATGAHPTASCVRPVLLYVAPRILWIALKTYVPLYVAWSAFRLRLPNRALVENVARSSVFLTGYTVTQYLGVMWFTSTVSPTITRLQHASFAWLSGLWLLLERKERRPELALYCVAQALNSLYLQSKKKGLVTHTPRWLKYLLLVVASGTLAAFNDQHPKFVSSAFGFEQYLTYK